MKLPYHILGFLVLWWTSFFALGDPPPVRILPLGDSITQGCCSELPIEGGYRTRLLNLLAGAGYAVDFVGSQQDGEDAPLADRDHEGHPGYRIDQIHAGIDGWLDRIDDPDVVLLMIGTNDFSQNYALSGAEDRLENLVEDIATQRPHARILLASLLLRTDSPALELAQEAFNQQIEEIVTRQASAGRHVHFVDMHGACDPADLFDGVHPRLAGYDKMADVWFPAITSVISPLGNHSPPAVSRVDPSHGAEKLAVVFSKPVEDLAADPDHFSIDGGVEVLAAELDETTKRVMTLTTTPMTGGSLYRISISGVRDRTPESREIDPGTEVGFVAESLQNSGFEDGLTGWMASGNVEVADGDPFVAAEGIGLAVFNGGQSTPNGEISQSFPTVPGMAYRLEYDVGVLAWNLSAQALEVSVEGTGSLLYHVDFLAGIGGGATSWQRKQLQFVADASSATLTFGDVSLATINIDLLLDRVRVIPLLDRTLTVSSTSPEGVGISVDPQDRDGLSEGQTPVVFSYFNGDVVTVTAPTSVGDLTFQHWLLDGSPFGTEPVIGVPMTADLELTAVYAGNPPSITQEPESVTVGVGQPVTFTVAADSVGPISYQWRHEGEEIDGATSASYEIASASPGDAGGYDVLVSNSYDTVPSQVAMLKVIPTGEVTNGGFEDAWDRWTVAGNVDVIEESGVYSASEGSWLVVFNGADTSPNGSIEQVVALEPGKTYALRYDAGIYSGFAGEQRLEVTLTGASELVSQLVVIEGNGGGTVSWTPYSHVFVADSPTAVLRFADVSTGTGSRDLLLDHVRLFELQECLVTVNSAETTDVPIEVSPPDIAELEDGETDFSRTYWTGTDVTLTAPANHGGLEFLHWLLDGDEIAGTEELTFTVESDVELTAVYGGKPPTVVVGPQSATVGEGQIVEFSVTAEGLGPISYQWRYEGEEIDGATSNTLTIGAAALADAGSYDVLVTNPYGTTPSSSAVLTVLPVGEVANGSFEGGLDGWTATGNVVAIEQEDGYTSSEGSWLVVFNGGDTEPNGVLKRVIALEPGKTYALRYDAGIFSGVAGEQQLQVTLIGGTELVSELIVLEGGGGGTVSWQPFSHIFVADSSTAVLRFADASETTNSRDLLLDHVRVMELEEFVVTVSSSGAASVPIGVAPADNGNLENGVTGFTRAYWTGAEVTLTAPALHEGLEFRHWLRDGVEIGEAEELTFTVESDLELTAVYGGNPPTITGGPQSVTVGVGRSVEFSVTAEGLGPISYQWRYEGEEIDGATSETFSIGAAALADAGSYDVLVTNPYGTTPSSSVSLTVVPVGEVANGSFEGGLDGWTATGNVVAIEQEDVYTATEGSWLAVFNGADSAPNGVLERVIALEPGKTYALRYDAGIFSGVAGEQTLEVTLTGGSDLVSELIVLEGGGGGTVSWTPFSHIFVADSATAALRFADASETTNSRDLLLDHVRIVELEEFVLTVNSSGATGVPIGISPPDNADLEGGVTGFTRAYWSGTEVTLTAPLLHEGLEFRHWLRDGVETGETEALAFTVESDVELTAVYGGNPPTIVNGPVDLTVGVGRSAVFAVTAEGLGPISFQWRYQGEAIDGATSDTLEITEVMFGDAGDYDVLVTNPYGTTPSTPAILTVVPVGDLTNGSFEVGLEDWVATGNVVAIEQGGVYSAIDGTWLAVFNAADTEPDGKLERVIALEPGKTYALRYAAGIYSGFAGEQQLQVTLTGGEELVSEMVLLTGSGGGVVEWTSVSHVFVADSPMAVLRFVDTSATTNSRDLLLDRIRLTEVDECMVSVASSVATSVPVTVTPFDNASLGDGVTGFIRTYWSGTEVTLAAPALHEGLEFRHWLRDGVEIGGTEELTFTVESDVELTAVYGGNPPTITGSPQSVTVGVGQPAVLSVAAEGLGPISYQWRYEGEEIDGATSDTFSIGAAALADAGSYDVLVTNPYGTTLSSPANLTVVPVGEVPNGGFEGGLDGWTATGNVEAIEQEDVYTATEGSWLVVFNGGDTSPNGAIEWIIALEPGQAYELRYDAGIFSGVAGEQRLAVTLTGGSDLVSELIVLEGDGDGTVSWAPFAHFFVADSTTAVLRFEDGSEGTSSRDLLLDHVRLVQLEACVVTVNSSVASSVPIAVVPEDNDLLGDGVTPFGRVYWPGTEVTLTAPAVHEGLDFLHWLKDGEIWGTSPDLIVSISESVEFTAVYAGQPPQITVGPNPVMVGLGQPVTFSVTAAGLGPISYQWRHQGEPIDGATSDTYSIASAELVDAGDYDVLVTNPYGTVPGGPAALVVVEPSELTNGGFESGLAGWIQRGVVAASDSGDHAPTEGSSAAVFPPREVGEAAGEVEWVLATVPGVSYLLEYDVGLLPRDSGERKLGVSVHGSGFLGSDVIVRDGQSGVLEWHRYGLVFAADSASTVLRFRDLSVESIDSDLLLDRVRVVVFATGGDRIPEMEEGGENGVPRGITGLPTGGSGTTGNPGTLSLRKTSSGFQLELSVGNPGLYILERSEDLVHWSEHSRIHTEGSGRIEFLDTDEPRERMFYRVREGGN